MSALAKAHQELLASFESANHKDGSAAKSAVRESAATETRATPARRPRSK